MIKQLISIQKKHPQRPAHNYIEESVRRRQTIQNPDFVERDSLFNDFLTHHNKNFELFLAEQYFKLIVDKKFTPQSQSELQNAKTEFHLEYFQ